MQGMLMSKRVTPQHKIADRAFPVQGHVFVRRGGFGILMSPSLAWPDREVGCRSCALHSGGSVMGRDVMTFDDRETDQWPP